MPKRRRPRPVTRFVFIDGEVHLIVERTPSGFSTRRLRGAERDRVVRTLDDAQYDLEAGLIGFGGRPIHR